jgi:hypothetical protein
MMNGQQRRAIRKTKRDAKELSLVTTVLETYHQPRPSSIPLNRDRQKGGKTTSQTGDVRPKALLKGAMLILTALEIAIR